MAATLRELLLEWKVRCPRRDGKLERVFPAHGIRTAWPLRRIKAGGAFLYSNFRDRVWHKILKELDLPPVSLHSARHTFISGLQTAGAEIGLAAQLAGHKNANVTLGYYTQATRKGDEMIAKLEQLYG